MSLFRFCTRAALAVACCAAVASPELAASSQSSPPETRPKADNELDAFMEKVLARREVNRQTLRDYILDEVERFEILGPGRTPLHRTRREYTWYVRDGMHVRSPVRFNGVSVGDRDRERYEANWMRREQERRARKAKNDKEREVTIESDGVQVSGAVVPTEPRFVSEAYFLEFKFEPGNYYLAGREQLEGRPVLRIEYYPTRMFADDDEERARAGSSDRPPGEERAAREQERDIEQKMNKTALVTLWIDPAEHQIVKYTFDNVWLDFLPGAWLVRMDDIGASMTMGQPFPGVWLPRDMNIHAGVTLANGSFDASYERTFAEYRLAEVETRIGPPAVPRQRDRERIPEVPQVRRVPSPRHDPEPPGPAARSNLPVEAPAGRSFPPRGWVPPGDQVRRDGAGHFPVPGGGDRETGSFAPQSAEQPHTEVIGEVRVHGNAFIEDEAVIAIAGVAVGQPLAEDGIAQVTARLQDARRFESVDVRKRYRSLTSTTDIALVIVVHERPGVRSAAAPSLPGVPDSIGQPIRRLQSKLMFLPIISYADGYGVTYGGRVSTVDLLGLDERLSVPLTWGGTRRAALEFERSFEGGPLTRVESTIAVWNRENPRFGIRDERIEVKGRAERLIADVVRTGVEAGRSTIAFGGVDDRLWTFGTSVVLDTRLSPAYPANAVVLGAGWTALHFKAAHPGRDRVNRYTAEARGYLRLFRQVVLAGRAAYTVADASLPPYERLLLGGSASLRGFRTGTFDGDRLFVTSAELRVPVTSILRGAKIGLTAFLDAGSVWDYGESPGGAAWHRGAGGGVFVMASLVRFNLDIARGSQTGHTRVHLSSGFGF